MTSHPPKDWATPESKIYGRRKGKTLRPFQRGLMSEVLPRFLIARDGPIDPQNLYAKPFRRLELEIGFGDGARLARRAGAHPDIAFIGSEPFVNGVAKAVAAIQVLGLENLRLYDEDARGLLRALPDACLDGVEILYPDPWPKRRQYKRRLICDAFLGLLARKMKDGAPLRLATDIDSYCAWILTCVLRGSDFLWRAGAPSDWLTPWPDWEPTRYEAKARREGRPSAYLNFTKRPRDLSAR